MNLRAAQGAADQAANFYAAAYDAKQQRFIDPRFAADMALAQSIRSMATGLTQLSVGLRATYIMLEEVKRSLPPR